MHCCSASHSASHSPLKPGQKKTSVQAAAYTARESLDKSVMAQAGAGAGPPGAAAGQAASRAGAPVAAAVERGPAAVAAVAAAAAPAAVVVAGPVIAILAGALVPPGPVLPPRFDVEYALRGPMPTKSNITCEIHAWIP